MGGINPYVYVGNNPINRIDSLGLSPNWRRSAYSFYSGYADAIVSEFDGIRSMMAAGLLTGWQTSLLASLMDHNKQLVGYAVGQDDCDPTEDSSYIVGYITGMLMVMAITEGGGASKSGLKPGTLSNEATRKWYHSQLDSISSKIDSNLPLRERALQAFKMRNEVKLQARELMADRAAAEALPSPKTLQDVVRKAYQQGLRGDDVWHYVLGGSQRSNAAVDSALGLTR